MPCVIFVGSVRGFHQLINTENYTPNETFKVDVVFFGEEKQLIYFTTDLQCSVYIFIIPYHQQEEWLASWMGSIWDWSSGSRGFEL